MSDINLNPNTQELDPMVVIDSLRNQLAAACVEIAKRDALTAKLSQQLQTQAQTINTLSDAIEQQNVAKTNGEVREGVTEEVGSA